MLTEFDKTETYETELAEKIDEIVRICDREKLPFFLAISTKNSEEGTEYKTDMYASKSNGINLKRDLLPNFVNVLNGFSTVPPMDIVDIDFD